MPPEGGNVQALPRMDGVDTRVCLFIQGKGAKIDLLGVLDSHGLLAICSRRYSKLTSGKPPLATKGDCIMECERRRLAGTRRGTWYVTLMQAFCRDV
jgi:hypothetical protein